MPGRSRRLKLLLVVLCFAALLTGGLAWIWVPGRVSRANYNRIEIGMSEAEVTSLMGRPPVELAPLGYEDVHAVENLQTILESPWPRTVRSWTTETHKVNVVLDGTGKVVSKSYSRRPDAGAVARLLDTLGL